MLVHGDLELALGPVLAVKGGRVVVEIHHSYRHHGRVVVPQQTLGSHLRCLVGNATRVHGDLRTESTVRAFSEALVLG